MERNLSPAAWAYRHGLLDPRTVEAADCANRALLGPGTLGIEVTEPRLAAGCGLGNIDPQHRPDGGAVAAIEAACDWPLPQTGATLVTIRPDADAYGAMAVLGLRQTGVAIDPAMGRRIAALARADRFDHGPWPGMRSRPGSAQEIDEIGSGTDDLGALAAGLADPRLTAEAGVTATRAWITGDGAPTAWRNRAAGAAAVLFAALTDGRVRLAAVDPGRIALVTGAVPGALRLGYRLAPVVVALDEGPRGIPPEPWRRITIAQWRAGHVDLMRVVALLGASEPGWGGAPCIIGSPQGAPCRLALPQVLAVVRDCRTPAPDEADQDRASHAA